MTELEINERKPVWIAFSCLFLDTDVTLSYGYIIRVCSESHYSLEELNSILKHEVAPALSANLMSVAGEWVGFDEVWLVKRIQKKRQRRFKLPAFLVSLLDRVCANGYIDDHWKVLAARINQTRQKT